MSRTATKNSVMVLASSIAIILPLSLCFWILSIVSLSSSASTGLPSPIRWFLSIFVPIVVTGWGFKKKSLDISGALSALIVGFIMTLSNYCFTISLLIFFVSSSKATKYRENQKRRIEQGYKDGGQRNWIQVVCNGGVACELALLYLIERGAGGEIPINFALDYNASWFALSVMGAIACCNGDTWASEIGSVFSKSDPWLITSFRRVPRGTNGGVSFAGLVVSAFGGLVVSVGFYLTLLVTANRETLALSPVQWPIMVTGFLAGLFGSVFDSVLGATLQFSGQDVVSGRIVENPGDRVKWISGIALLDNHSVNLLSTLITAISTPSIAMAVWNYADPSSVLFGS